MVFTYEELIICKWFFEIERIFIYHLKIVSICRISTMCQECDTYTWSHLILTNLKKRFLLSHFMEAETTGKEVK